MKEDYPLCHASLSIETKSGEEAKDEAANVIILTEGPACHLFFVFFVGGNMPFCLCREESVNLNLIVYCQIFLFLGR
jgi:hypothetical protein